jgi:hypothetical protein
MIKRCQSLFGSNITSFFALSFVVQIAFANSTDTYLSQQWGLHNQGQPQHIELDFTTTYKVQARQGVDLNLPAPFTATKKVIVAILDTGIDHSHPDLAGVLVRKEKECAALEKFTACVSDKDRKTCEKIWMDKSNPEVDTDKNGYPMDCSGWSILGSVNAANILGRPDFEDDQGHGTHVAGIVGAISNSQGVQGVSGNVLILPVQVLGKKPSEPLKPLSLGDISPEETGKEKYRTTLGDMVARGVNYAIHSGAQVINFSLGWPEAQDSEYLRSVIKAAQDRGIIIVAAAGNDSTRALLRPCGYENVICVAAHGPDGSLSHFSNYGSGVDVAAPGTNILSTYPREKRSIRFRSEKGYEFLHGTSQATPLVTGVVAEMLARGIPNDEIYPRLILSSAPLLEKLPILEGAAHDLNESEKPEAKNLEPRFVLGGRVQLAAALRTTLRPLILPASKEKVRVQWNTSDTQLKFDFALKNFGSDFSAENVKVTARHFQTKFGITRPDISRVDVDQNGLWKKGETRKLSLTLTLSSLNFSSDLDFSIEVQTPYDTRRFVLSGEVIVPVGPGFKTSHSQELIIQGAPQTQISWIAIDENLDGLHSTDYVAVSAEMGQWTAYLFKRQSTGYSNSGSFSLKLGDEIEFVREQILARLPVVNAKQKSRYAVGIFIDRSSKKEASVLKIYTLDESFKIVNTFEIPGGRVQIPLEVSWQILGNEMVPTWMALGYDPDRRRGVRDHWENPSDLERPQLRAYFVNLEGKLKAQKKFGDYEAVDILQPTFQDLKAGRIPVLLAKNQGTENRSSYLSQFQVGVLQQGVFQSSHSLVLDGRDHFVGNLLDTRVDQVLSLDLSGKFQGGTFWFSEGAERSQRITVLNNFGERQELHEQNLKAARGVVDSALRVRAVFASENTAGTFAFTNSEVQFHDLKSGAILVRSLERYTFYPDTVFTASQFPIAIGVDGQPEMLPGLFTTEDSEISRGFKVKIAHRDKKGEWQEIYSPANLRFQAQRGCRALPTPVATDAGHSALDYYCGTKMIRVPLRVPGN